MKFGDDTFKGSGFYCQWTFALKNIMFLYYYFEITIYCDAPQKGINLFQAVLHSSYNILWNFILLSKTPSKNMTLKKKTAGQIQI